MATTDRWLQPSLATDGDELDELAGDVRWLAPDARPAMTVVLRCLEDRQSGTVADVAAATGFTERSVARILRELTVAGTLTKSGGLSPPRYRRRSPAGGEG